MSLRRPQNLRAVTFDVGGTLLHVHPSVGHVYAEVASRHGIRADPGEVNRKFRLAWTRQTRFRHTRRQWADLVDASLEGAPGFRPPAAFFDEIYDRFRSPEVWRLRPDAEAAFARLKHAGLKLGLISNWDERLRPLLAATRIDTWFDAIVISCEVGACKPDSAIFLRGVADLGVAPEEVLHVGDSLEMDVEGAVLAGMQAVLLGRELPVQKKCYVENLHELCALILGPVAGGS